MNRTKFSKTVVSLLTICSILSISLMTTFLIQPTVEEVEARSSNSVGVTMETMPLTSGIKFYISLGNASATFVTNANGQIQFEVPKQYCTDKSYYPPWKGRGITFGQVTFTKPNQIMTDLSGNTNYYPPPSFTITPPPKPPSNPNPFTVYFEYGGLHYQYTIYIYYIHCRSNYVTFLFGIRKPCHYYLQGQACAFGTGEIVDINIW